MFDFDSFFLNVKLTEVIWNALSTSIYLIIDFFLFQLLGAVTKKLEIKETPLPQDLTEGVDEDEWVGFICYYNTVSSYLSKGHHHLQLPVQSVPITTKVVSLNPIDGNVYSIQHFLIKFVSDLLQVSYFLRVLQFPPPIKLTATIQLKYC